MTEVRPLSPTSAPSSGARTTNGDTGPLRGYSLPTSVLVQLDVTAVAGTTPTLDVVVEDTIDGTNWYQVAAFAQKTAPGRELLRVATPFADTLRVRWIIGGVSPSFTFSGTVNGRR